MVDENTWPNGIRQESSIKPEAQSLESLRRLLRAEVIVRVKAGVIHESDRQIGPYGHLTDKEVMCKRPVT